MGRKVGKQTYKPDESTLTLRQITASFFIVAFRSFDSIEYDEDGVEEAQHGFGTRHLRVSRDGISYVHERMDRHEA